MPYAYVIEPELNMIYYFIAGYATAKELIELETTTFHHPDRRPNMQIVVDLQMASIDVDMESVKAMLSKNSELEKKGWELEKTVVITQNRLVISLAEAYEILGHNMPLKLKLCRSLDEALRWLGMENEMERVRSIHTRLEGEVLNRT